MLQNNVQRNKRWNDFATVRCHGCGSEISIRIDPARLWIGRTDVECFPCLEAPHICEFCREDPRKLDKTREAMDQHFTESSIKPNICRRPS